MWPGTPPSQRRRCGSGRPTTACTCRSRMPASGSTREAAYAARESSGLAGMRERASLLGGDLSIDSALGSGVRVTAELPLVAEGERPA